MTRRKGLLDTLGHIKQVIIGNAAEPAYFYPSFKHRHQDIFSNPDYRMKICSSVFSDNMRKNFALVALLAQYQHSHNFELRLAGRVPSNYSHLLNGTLMDEFHLGQFL
eukprot:gene13526-16539_t